MVDLTRFAFPQGRFPQRSNQGTSLTDVLGAFGQAAGRAEQQQLQRQELERALDQRRNLEEDLRIFTGEPLVVGGRVGPVEGGREVVDVAQPTEKNRAQALARIMSLDPELGKNLQNIEKINQELAISADENARANFNQSLKQSETSAKFGARAALQMKETPTLDGKRKLAKEAMTNIDALGLDPQFTEELKEDLQAIVNAENIDTANTKINGIIALGVPTADILSSIQEEQKQLAKDFTEQQNQATIGQGVVDILSNVPADQLPDSMKFLKQRVDQINQLNTGNPQDRPRFESGLMSLGRTMQQFPELFKNLQEFSPGGGGAIDDVVAKLDRSKYTDESFKAFQEARQRGEPGFDVLRKKDPEPLPPFSDQRFRQEKEKFAAELEARDNTDTAKLQRILDKERLTDIKLTREEKAEKKRLAQKAIENRAARVNLKVEQAMDVLDKLGLPATGFGASTLSMIGGTDAAEMDVTLNTIKSILGFKELQDMRAASPTGGALGQVSDTENRLLQSTVDGLDLRLDPEELKRNLENIRRHTKNWFDAVNSQHELPEKEKDAVYVDQRTQDGDFVFQRPDGSLFGMNPITGEIKNIGRDQNDEQTEDGLTPEEAEEMRRLEEELGVE